MNNDDLDTDYTIEDADWSPDVKDSWKRLMDIYMPFIEQIMDDNAKVLTLRKMAEIYSLPIEETAEATIEEIEECKMIEEMREDEVVRMIGPANFRCLRSKS